jgi:microcystin-dependent protein
MLVDVSIPSKVAVVKAQTISTKNSTGIEFDVPTEYGTTSEKQTISIEGDGQPITIDNYQPSIGLSYIICVEDGEYPPRS